MKKVHAPFLLTLMLVTLLASGCGALRPRYPVPDDLVHQARIPGMEDVRILIDLRRAHGPEGVEQEIKQLVRESQEAAAVHTPCCDKELIMLSLSGGGENGAFGVGILNGWTAAGNRPEFDMVTGISTGSLIAPFAFLGPDYDSVLKESYTTITIKDIAVKRPLYRILRLRDAVADTAPLERLIARSIGQKELEAVAREHARGRRLLIGTTHLDAEQPAFWDMGAIAASGHPQALEVFRKVMLASASIPVAFPPVYFEVEVGGKRYDEMHVDGGVVTEVFGAKILSDAAEAWREAGYRVTGRLYIVRNARLDPEWKKTQPRLPSIGARSISTLIKNQGVGDIFRAYVFTQESGIEFNLASIPLEFDAKATEPFEQAYMKALYELAYELARDGHEWSKYPPYFVPSSEATSSDESPGKGGGKE